MSEAPAPRSSTPPSDNDPLSAAKTFSSTPRKAKPSSIQDRAVDRPVNKLVDIRIKYDREMQGLFVEVPDGEFQEYFPGGSEPPATKEFKFTVNLKSEAKMYSGVCKGLEDSLPDHEEFIVKDTGRWQDMAEGSTHAKAKNDKQPDLGIYPRHDAAKKAVKIEKLLTEDQEHKLGKRVDFIGRVSWAWLSLSVEVKNKKNTAPFSYDNKEDWLPDNDEARKSRGQLADYAKEIFARQHRQFLFTIVVIRDHARIVRWDRAGAAVSKSFNYIQSPEKLGGFIYRYATMTPVERGFDPTATLATKEEVAILRAYVASLKDCDVSDYLRKCMNSVIDEDGKDDEDGKGKNAKDDKNDAASYEWPIYKIELDGNKFVSANKGGPEQESNDEAGEDDTAANIDPHPGAKRYLLVGRAMSTSLSPTGRGTKGFAAYDMTGKTHVFLKDTWRPHSTCIHAEGEIYAELAKHEVTNIATLLYCGDVGGGTPQTTRTQELLKKANTDVKILPRIHYRLIFEEIARPLQQYGNSVEMARAMYAALTAHRQAWEKAGILHRDISDGNIMICDDAKDEHGERAPTAFLNDWDLAKYKQELAKPPTQKTRSGTWQFISALLLKFPQKQYEVSDDLESFIHVVNWLSFWYHKNDFSETPEQLGNTLYSIYDESCPSPDGCDMGGRLKTVYIQSGKPPLKLDTEMASQGHFKLLQSLATLLKEHYESVPVSQLLDSNTSNSHTSNVQIAVVKNEVTDNKDAFKRFMPRLRQPNPTSKADSSCTRALPASTTRNGVLSTHSAIIAAFEDALNGDWKAVDKTKNFVMTYTNSGTHILRTRTSSGKRRAESSPSGGTEGDEQPSKKRRSGNSKRAQAASEQGDQSNLSAVPEEEED